MKTISHKINICYNPFLTFPISGILSWILCLIDQRQRIFISGISENFVEWFGLLFSLGIAVYSIFLPTAYSLLSKAKSKSSKIKDPKYRQYYDFKGCVFYSRFVLLEFLCIFCFLCLFVSAQNLSLKEKTFFVDFMIVWGCFTPLIMLLATLNILCILQKANDQIDKLIS